MTDFSMPEIRHLLRIVRDKLSAELMRSLEMVQHNNFNEAIKIIRNGLASKSLDLNFLTVQSCLD